MSEDSSIQKAATSTVFIVRDLIEELKKQNLKMPVVISIGDEGFTIDIREKASDWWYVEVSVKPWDWKKAKP